MKSNTVLGPRLRALAVAPPHVRSSVRHGALPNSVFAMIAEAQRLVSAPGGTLPSAPKGQNDIEQPSVWRRWMTSPPATRVEIGLRLSKEEEAVALLAAVLTEKISRR